MVSAITENFVCNVCAPSLFEHLAIAERQSIYITVPETVLAICLLPDLPAPEVKRFPSIPVCLFVVVVVHNQLLITKWLIKRYHHAKSREIVLGYFTYRWKTLA